MNQQELLAIQEKYKQYTIEQFKNDMKITDQSELCMGDIWHNQDIDILFSDLTDNCELVKLIASVLLHFQRQKFDNRDKSIYTDSKWESTGLKWIDRIGLNLNKGDIVKLNAICKSKSHKTYLKRVASFMYKQTCHSVYTTMFNKYKIELFDQLFKLHEDQIAVKA